MTPLLADAIDFPIVFVAGVIVLVPLMAFEVFVEALILKAAWHLPYRQLCEFAFVSILLSLLCSLNKNSPSSGKSRIPAGTVNNLTLCCPASCHKVCPPTD